MKLGIDIWDDYWGYNTYIISQIIMEKEHWLDEITIFRR